MKRGLLLGAGLVTVSLGLGAGLTAVMGGFTVRAWLAAAFLLLISISSLYGLYRKAGRACLLAWMLLAAFALRLGLGVTLMKVLPAAGYDTEQQNAGYVFFDAYRRDAQALELAQSDAPLTSVFNRQYFTDQYGGYLGLSALVYRGLAGGEHQPLLMLILAAFAGSAGAAFLWLLLGRIGHEPWRKLAGWIFVLYPEAVLLGAAHMRDPYLISFLAMFIWAGLEWHDAGLRRTWPWMAAAVVGLLLFSPGMILPGVAGLAIWLLAENKNPGVRWRTVILVGLAAVLGVSALAYALAAPGGTAASPLQVILNWFREASGWDMTLALRNSGMLAHQLEGLPAWFRNAFILLYGLLQPVLPAAIMDNALPLARGLIIWLSLGWYLLLPLVMYGTLAAFIDRHSADRVRMRWLASLLWFWMALSSLRAGGDVWDNPRYRTLALVFFCLFAAWAIQSAREHGARWLKRIFLIEGIALAFFLQWYASRYYQWGSKLPFYSMLLLILAASLAVVVGGWLYDGWQTRKKRAGVGG
jgi:hypothetical protein